MDTIQMLTRDTQVGEYYIMGPPAHDPPVGTKQFMDMMIYDEEKDRHVMITWEQALAATCLDENNGQLGANPFNVGGIDCNTWMQAAKAWKTLNETGFDGTKLTPVYIVVAKPFIQHKMHSAILCVAGQDTGRTLYGPSDMQLSANTQVKTIEGCACYFKLALTQTCASFQTISNHFNPFSWQALHGSLQICHYKAPECLCAPRHFVRRLRGRRRNQVLWHAGI